MLTGQATPRSSSRSTLLIVSSQLSNRAKAFDTTSSSDGGMHTYKSQTLNQTTFHASKTDLRTWIHSNLRFANKENLLITSWTVRRLLWIEKQRRAAAIFRYQRICQLMRINKALFDKSGIWNICYIDWLSTSKYKNIFLKRSYRRDISFCQHRVAMTNWNQR